MAGVGVIEWGKVTDREGAKQRGTAKNGSAMKNTMPTCHFIGANMWVLKTTC